LAATEEPGAPFYRDDPEERAAIMAECALPLVGTPERARLEARHRQMIAGLMKVAHCQLGTDSLAGELNRDKNSLAGAKTRQNWD
jgi:hypothetical protein